MRTLPTSLSACLPLVAFVACGLGDDRRSTPDTDTSDTSGSETFDTSTGPLTVSIKWVQGAGDPWLEVFLATPTVVSPVDARVSLCAARGSMGVSITSVERDGEPLVLEPVYSTGCVAVAIDPLTVEAGDSLELVADRNGVSLALPSPPPVAELAFDALARPDAMWIATAKGGLLGVGAGDAYITYGGVSASAAFDPEAQRPQSSTVLVMAPAGARAMWVGTAATGVSWFDPGDDAMRDDDDQWVHGQPAATPKYGAELAQTPLAIAPDPFAPDVAWIGTLNGVYRAQKMDDEVVFERVLDGTATALAIDPEGRVWCGFSTATRLTVSGGGEGAEDVTLPAASDALVVFDPGADRALDPSEDTITALPDEGAVTALAADARGVWIGTPFTLMHATIVGGGVALEAILDKSALEDLAVVDLLASPSGVWAATRSECESGRGRLLELHVDEDATLITRDAVTSVSDLSERGFGERDFAKIGLQATGRLWVSTFVGGIPKGLLAEGTTATARGCVQPTASERSADLYLVDETGTAQRIGRDP